MYRLAIVTPNHQSPSGLPAVVQQMVGKLLRSGADVTLISPKPSSAFPTPGSATETVNHKDGRLALEWWPNEEFRTAQRSRLCFRMEQLFSQKKVDRVLSIGVRQCGFTAVVASRLARISASVFVTYHDAFDGLLKAPHELETVVRFADHIIGTNPEVLSHLLRFYDTVDRGVLLDSRACIRELALPEGEMDPEEESHDGVVTTGQLNHSVHLPELLDRVQQAWAEDGVSTWKHAGTVAPETLLQLFRLMTSMGLQDSFSTTGVMSRLRYAQVVRGARRFIRLDGERDTNLAAYEAEAAGIRVSVPESDPFPPLVGKFPVGGDLPAALDFEALPGVLMA